MELSPADSAPTAPMHHRLRVLLADDDETFLEALSQILANDTQLEVIGTTFSANAAQQTATLQPEIVLISLRIPNLTGLEAARKIKAQPNAPMIVLMTIDARIEIENHEAARIALADALRDRPILSRGMLAFLYRLSHLNPPKP